MTGNFLNFREVTLLAMIIINFSFVFDNINLINYHILNLRREKVAWFT